MEFALSALLILILLLPGFIFQNVYNKGYWRWNSPTSNPSITEQLPIGVVIAGILHFIWIFLASATKHPVDLNAVMMLILGTYGYENKNFETAIHSVTNHPRSVLFYFTSLYFASAFLGYGVHKLIRMFKLDRKTKFLRFKNEWYYLLSGEVTEFKELKNIYEKGLKGYGEVDGVWLSAVVHHVERDYLYKGFVADFYFDKAGNLDVVLLRSISRRVLSKDLSPDVMDERYFEIAGDYFVLRYSEMSTINIEYLFLKKVKGKSGVTQTMPGKLLEPYLPPLPLD